jgi:Domain of unknown function (DUF4397)/Secretion system C-terminal sorting domain
MKKRNCRILALAFVAAAVSFTAPIRAQTARVQMVQASPDPVLFTIDVYMDDVLWKGDFNYRTATPFVDVPAGNHTFAIAPWTSSSSAEAYSTFEVTLEDGKAYHMVSAGVLDPGQFPANPDGKDTGLNLYVVDDARESARSPSFGFFDIRDFNAVLEWPACDFSVDIPFRGIDRLWNGLTYGDFLSYYSGLTKNGIVARVHPGGMPDSIMFAVQMDLSMESTRALFSVWTGVSSAPEKILGMLIRPDGSQLFGTVVTAVDDPDGEIPSLFRLTGNYPNPFNPTTTVRFELPQAALVGLEVFDLTGRRVRNVPERTFSAGRDHSIRVDAVDLPSGTYFYRVTARMEQATHVRSAMMTLLK